MTEDLHATGRQGESCPPASINMLIVFCTFPDQKSARRISKEIIYEHLAACANLIPGIESIYRWEGNVQQENEALVLFKVASTGFIKLEKALLEKHPYETPEIVGLAADQVSESYLKWVIAGELP